MRLSRLCCALLFVCAATAAIAQSQPGTSAAPGTPLAPVERQLRSGEARQHIVTVRTDQPVRVASASSGSPTWLTALIAALPAIVALIGSLIVVRLGNRQSEKNSTAALNLATANAQAATNQRTNELEIERIENWLSDFFGPFMQLSEENKRIAEVLRSRQSDPSFRTLKALLDPEWRKSASQTDLNLISRIVGNGVQLRNLIREKAGATGTELSDYLARAAAHFSILELAEAGALTDETAVFDRYVYPRQLDPVLKLERERLETRRDGLLIDLSKRHPAAPPLAIPRGLALDCN